MAAVVGIYNTVVPYEWAWRDKDKKERRRWSSEG